jgi:hypothetical protein
MTKQVHFVMFDAGGGHRTVVEALTLEIAKRYPSWNVHSLNISRIIFDPIDPFYQLTRLQGEGFFYNDLIISRGWIWFYPFTMFLARLRIWGLYPFARKRLQNYWLEQQPDLVVSTIPLYNKLLWQSLKSVKPKTPFATLLSDLADDPPHHYIEPLEQSVICPTEQAVQQAKAIGISHENIFQTSGLSLLPQFYDKVSADISSERLSLGLKPNRLTGLVFFGSQGSEIMLSIAQYLEKFYSELQLIFLCGRNEKVATLLRDSSTRLIRHVENFTREVPHFMHLSDFFIGKPGSNSISEAIAMTLPVIVEGNQRIVSHEKANVDWIRQYQLGIVIDSFHNVDKAVEKILNPKIFEKLHSNAAALQNRAVFEIPEILQKIIEKT